MIVSRSKDSVKDRSSFQGCGFFRPHVAPCGEGLAEIDELSAQMWEIPMYAIFDEKQDAGVHLMDPWLDSSDTTAVMGWMKSTFLTHYNGNRQP